MDMGLEQAGMTTVFQCEIDPRCQQVLRRHWPDVPKWDDVSTLTGKHILEQTGGVDVVAWGSPCQDLSVAGKRAGLAGGRSGLFHEGMRIIHELQEESNGLLPRVSIWENVVGAMSSNGGADFETVLTEMVESGSHLVEWAILDAQNFGVPQRRRRIFLVSCFDSAIAERSPNPLLPVAKGSGGNSAKGKSKKPSATGTFEVGFGDGGEELPFVKSRRAQSETDAETWIDGSVAPTLNGFDNLGDTRATVLIVDGTRVNDVRVYDDEVTPTLKSRMGTGGNNVPLIASALGNGEQIINSLDAGIYHHQSIPTQTARNGQLIIEGTANILYQDAVGSLAAVDYKGPNRQYVVQDKLIVEGTTLGFSHTQGLDPQVSETAFPTLRANGSGHAVAYSIREDAIANNFSATEIETARSLSALQPSPQSHHAQTFIVDAPEPTALAVRRLTPLECERLMGWPDDHTRWTDDNLELADSHRYRMCGNGVVSNVARWVGEQIMKANPA